MTRIAAIIPARGGSKRLPGKNLRLVGGRTLVARAIDVAAACGCEPWVSTEDDAIAAHAASLGALVRARPIALASDRASTESVIEDWWRHAFEGRPDVIVLLQPTSPLRSAADVRSCIEAVVSGGYDASLTVTVSHTHHFAGRLRAHANGTRMWIPDRPIEWRPRTQELAERAHENGAVYAFTGEHWSTHHNRLAHYKRTAAIVMPEWRAIDVDTAEELERADMYARKRWEEVA